jgi:dUTP pyrophosphatase
MARQRPTIPAQSAGAAAPASNEKPQGHAVAPGPVASGVSVSVERLPHAVGLALPEYQTAGAAGLDLVAAVHQHAPIHLARGARVLIPTGLKLALPHGYEAQVRPRSGLALKHGVTVLNSPGTIDADYRGEVCVILVNLGEDDFVIRRGERIAQLVIAPVAQATLLEVTSLDGTARGGDGFGSTGCGT